MGTQFHQFSRLKPQRRLEGHAAPRDPTLIHPRLPSRWPSQALASAPPISSRAGCLRTCFRNITTRSQSNVPTGCQGETSRSISDDTSFARFLMNSS